MIFALPVLGLLARAGGRAILGVAGRAVGLATIRRSGIRAGAMQVKVSPTPRFMKHRFKSARKRMSNFQTPYKRSAVFLDQWVQRNFQQEGKPVGGWMPLKGGGRRVPGGGIDPTAKILQDSGRLRASFESFSTRRNAGIGSGLEYAKTHNEGMGPIPQRRILPLKREVRQDIRRIFDQHVDQSLEPIRWGRKGRR